MNSIDDYSKELINTAIEMKELAFQYKDARAEWAKAFNRITVLIQQSGLASDKAAFENKIPKLINIPEYRDEAISLNETLNNSSALYKGLEEVLKAYQAHISGIQSVIKYNMNGEIAEATRQKYGVY